jgi:hypothetical protein
LKTGCAIAVAALLILSGCGTPGSGGLMLLGGRRVLLTVDFQPGQTIRYKFVSSRKIAIDWDPNLESQENRVQEMVEELEMVVAYTPVEVDPYGISTIRATCESVKVTRAGGPSRRTFGTDAVQTAQDRSFTIKVDPRGRITDRSELKSLVQEMGKSAFRQGGNERRRIKEPDMIGDFVASQWFLWDAVSSIERPAQGVTPGQTWRSQLSVPTPMVMRKGRDVTYRLDKVRRADGARIAVIKSKYTLATAAPSTWPVPYSGRFQMSGTFGFLSAYEVSDLKGQGQELFNVDAGRVESYRQDYTMHLKAGLPPIGIRANPNIRIDQTLTMERQ